MTGIDDCLRDHYRGMQLDSTALSEIYHSNDTPVLTRISEFTERWKSFRWVVAALLLSVITLGTHQYSISAERTLRMLNEVTMNHSTRLQPEFKANSIGKIDQQMAQLQFKVSLPSEFTGRFDVIGARYCTINGELTVHLTFVDKDTNKQISLFIGPPAEGQRTIDATHDQINGVNVKLWTESGLFYAMASRSALN